MDYNAQIRRIKRAWLREVIDSKDKARIFNYCYHRATRKESERQMFELAAYGTTVSYITDEYCAKIFRLISWWCKRLNK